MQVSSKSPGEDPRDFGKHVQKTEVIFTFGAALAASPTRQKPNKNAGFVKKPWGGPQGFWQTCAETDVICSFGIAGWANCVTNRFRAQAVLQKGFVAQVVTERVAKQKLRYKTISRPKLCYKRNLRRKLRRNMISRNFGID